MTARFTAVVLALVLISAGVHAALPADAFYEPSRPRFTLTTTRDISINFAPKNRALDLRVTYPIDGEHLPVIIWSHGAFGSREAYAPLVGYWAARGYVVIQPTHQDSIKKGTIPLLSNPFAFREWDVRPQEISYIIDHLGDVAAAVPGLGRAMNRDVIGVGGHSYGAHTTMLLAGMTVNTGILKKQRKSFADPRPRVFVMVSPQGTGRIIDTQSFSTMTPPSLFVTGSKDEVGVNPPPYTWRLEPFQHAPPRDKYLLFIDGAHHGFGGISGRRFPGSGEDDSDQVEAVRSVALAMFDAYLKNDPDARAYLIHNALSEASAGRFQLTGK